MHRYPLGSLVIKETLVCAVYVLYSKVSYSSQDYSREVHTNVHLTEPFEARKVRYDLENYRFALSKVAFEIFDIGQEQLQLTLEGNSDKKDAVYRESTVDHENSSHRL